MTENPSERNIAISSALQNILNANISLGIPGLSACISTSSGQIWSSTAGVASITSNTALASNQVFGVGSITKVFVAVVILQLVEENKLLLSTTISDILPRSIWHDVGNAKDATVEQLLSHRSGIQSWEDDAVWKRDARGKNLDLKKVWNKTEALDYIRRPSPLAVGNYSYANTNFQFLGLMIERVTRQTAESEIRKRIIEPLGLNDTYLEGFEAAGSAAAPRRYHWNTSTFRESAGICPQFSIPAGREDLIDVTGSSQNSEWLAGGMFSSPQSLCRFFLALRDGQLLSASSMAFLKDWKSTGEESAPEVGHGVFRVRSPRGHGKWVGHNGSVLGFTGSAWWADGEDCLVAVAANVGTTHCGVVPGDASSVVLKTEFLKLARMLAASEEDVRGC